MLIPNNLQDLGVSGIKMTTASLTICLCSCLRFFQGYLLFLCIQEYYLSCACGKWLILQRCTTRGDSKSSSRVIMIHHIIMYLEMSSYAHYLTRQTTTTEEIPFTAEIPDILNLMKQWFSCLRATVLLGRRLWICMSLCTILSYFHHRKKNTILNHFTDTTIGTSQQKWKHHPQVHYGSCTQLERADKWFAGIWKKHPQLLKRLKSQFHRDTDCCKQVKRPQKLRIYNWSTDATSTTAALLQSSCSPPAIRMYVSLSIPG